MSDQITNAERGLPGAGRRPHKKLPAKKARTERAGSIDGGKFTSTKTTTIFSREEASDAARELRHLFRIASRILEAPIPPATAVQGAATKRQGRPADLTANAQEAKTPNGSQLPNEPGKDPGKKDSRREKKYVSVQVPIDYLMILRGGLKRELNYRFLETALPEYYDLRLSRFTLKHLLGGVNWGIRNVTEEQLKRKIQAHLAAGRTTIQYRTAELPKIVRFHYAWKRRRAKAWADAAKRLHEQPDFMTDVFLDFYKAHWNGLVGVVEGLAEIPKLPWNIKRKIEGKKWASPRFEAIRFSYKSDYGRKYSGAWELGAGLGLTGPLAALSRSTTVVNGLQKSGEVLGVSPQVANYVRGMIWGAEAIETGVAGIEVWESIQVIRTGKITVNGKTRKATRKEVLAAYDHVFMFGVSRTTSAAMTRITADTVASMGQRTSKPDSRDAPERDRTPRDEFDEQFDRLERGELADEQGAMLGDLMFHRQRREAIEVLREQLDERLPGRPGRTPEGEDVNPNPGWQSAHSTSQAALRNLPEYNPGDMITRFLPTGKGHAHTRFDQYWQRRFREIRARTGRDTTTARELVDVTQEAARESGAFSPKEAESVAQMIQNDVFFDLGLEENTPLRMPGG